MPCEFSWLQINPYMHGDQLYGLEHIRLNSSYLHGGIFITEFTAMLGMIFYFFGAPPGIIVPYKEYSFLP